MNSPDQPSKNKGMSVTPFRRLLIANRGEIAVRIIRSAKVNGYSTIAVYSEADATAMHVRMADEAVCIGPAAPLESYLDIDAIITAAKATGADAIHPGYGFLAENEKLPAACAAAGIVFIGPSDAAVRAMGNKADAKSLMAEAGVPCVPGYHGEEQGDERLLAEADEIGWPVMIKAVAGGGGRGMRLVAEADSFLDALKSARSEARAAFGDDRVLLEKAIVHPRHIEIQIMVDRYGNAIHLGERDCTVQRRHQKIIEEAPSPAVSPKLREEMGATAVRAALAIGYEGAGTLEFLLAEDGSWYFMEMNTRLQVEHPVTEAITGLDLVAMQLRIAGGAPLELQQEDIRFSGHAMEVRLCAEEPANGFMPQSGRVELWKPSPAIRTDHALLSGCEVPPYYDSMIAKLIAHGSDRETARRNLLQGLDQTIALGVRTNQGFLASCLDHPAFVSANVTTDFVSVHESDLLADREDELEHAVSLMAAFLHAAPEIGLTHGFDTPVRLERDGVIHDRSVRAEPKGFCEVLNDVDEMLCQITVHSMQDHIVRYMEANIERHAVFWRHDDRVIVQIGNTSWDFVDRSFGAGIAGDAGGGDGKIRASMTGRIVAVEIAVGDMVTTGQKIVVLEAMKMEHAHTSGVSGKVAAIHVAAGDQVDAHRIMVEIEAE